MDKIRLYICLLLVVVLLGACSRPQNDTESTVSSANDSYTDTGITSSTSNIDISAIPNGNELLDEINLILNQINIDNVSGFIDYNLTDDDIILMIDVVMQVDDTKLKASALKFTKNTNWDITSIKEYNSDPIRYYYGSEAIIDNIDVYDFNTGEIISNKKSDFDTDKDMQEYKDKMDQLTDDFNNALEKIQEEYSSDTKEP